MDRRGFIVGTGAALSGGLGLLELRGVARAAGEASPSSLEQRFADFALAVSYADLPPEVIAAVKRALLDTLGCAFGAVGSDAATIAQRTIGKTFGSGDAATLIGYPGRATLEGALFVNGVLVRSLDLNDTYIGTDPLHPSEVLPTALALGEERAVSGRRLIEAIVVGYEVSMRVNDAISFIERGLHPLCAMAYGAPAVAGKVWGLRHDAIASAIGLSAARGYTSFVVNSGAISMMKAMGFGASAADALFVTRLAAEGFTGPSGTLEYMAARMKPALANLSVDLDVARYRMPKVAFKRFPVQIELQSVAEAGVNLSSKLRGRIGDIRSIRVESYPGIIERVADAPKFKPETKGTADHSMPVCLAMALVDGDVTVAQFEKDRWRWPDVMALVEKTSVRPGEALMAKLPKGRGASVEISLAGGETLRETIEIAEGDAQRPLSQASLERKFMTFAMPVLGKARAARIVSLVDRIETLANIRELTRSLSGPGRQSAN